MKSSRKSDQRPSMQFYPKDWLSETGLQCVSYAAKGLWIDLLCHMWMSPERGVLEANALQNLTKLEANDLQKYIGELLKFDVCEKDENSAIICRRMYREWQYQRHISEVRSEAGKSAKHEQNNQQNNRPSSPSPIPSASATDKTIKKDIPANAGSPQAVFIKSWSELYESETGVPFKADRKDFVIIARLIKKFGADEVVSRAKILFAACQSRKLWFTKTGMADFTIGKLSSQWNGLIKEPSAEERINKVLKKKELENGA